MRTSIRKEKRRHYKAAVIGLFKDSDKEYVPYEVYHQAMADRDYFLSQKRKLSEMYGSLLRENRKLKHLIDTPIY